MEWTLLFYETPRAGRPVARFIEQLPENARAEAAALLVALRERGNALRAPNSKSLGNGLFELRGLRHAVRIYYTFLPGRRIVLIDGLVKKRDAIPTTFLKRLRRLRREVLAFKT